jgi:MarR family transcriptional regulator, lower aerobic nicotinate degradation pathway regulator
MLESRDEREIYSKPGHLIRRLQQIAVSLFLSQTQEFGITPVQYSALVAIQNNPGIDQTTLTEIVALDRTTIGEVMERLEAKKLLLRARGTNDRRAKTLFLTPAGKKLTAKMRPHVEAAQRHIVGPLSVAERKQFVQLMRKLVDLNNGHSRVPLRARSTKGKPVSLPKVPIKRREESCSRVSVTG